MHVGSSPIIDRSSHWPGPADDPRNRLALVWDRPLWAIAVVSNELIRWVPSRVCHPAGLNRRSSSTVNEVVRQAWLLASIIRAASGVTAPASSIGPLSR